MTIIVFIGRVTTGIETLVKTCVTGNDNSKAILIYCLHRKGIICVTVALMSTLIEYIKLYG
jgi:hypothetical protein